MELKVVFTSALDAFSLERFHRDVVPRLTKANALNLYINSPGGQVPVALALARFVQMLKGRTTTYNMCRCDSAAIVLFAAGQERIVAKKGCSFRLHEVEKELYGPQTIRMLKRELGELRTDTWKICRFLELQTGRTQLDWQGDMLRQRVLTGLSARRMNLATRIGDVSVKHVDVMI